MEKKYNRYFHYLAQDSDLWGKLENALRTEAGLFLFSGSSSPLPTHFLSTSLPRFLPVRSALQS